MGKNWKNLDFSSVAATFEKAITYVFAGNRPRLVFSIYKVEQTRRLRTGSLFLSKADEENRWEHKDSVHLALLKWKPVPKSDG